MLQSIYIQQSAQLETNDSYFDAIGCDPFSHKNENFIHWLKVLVAEKKGEKLRKGAYHQINFFVATEPSK